MSGFHPFFRLTPRSGGATITFLFILLFIGGALSSHAMAAQIYTDQLDYPPGDQVIITGVGFMADEPVTVQVTQLDGFTPVTPDYDPWEVYANGFGNFETSWIVPEDAVGETLLVTATGQTSNYVATTTFTDATTLLSLTYDMQVCPNSLTDVCAVLMQKCPGGTNAPLANRPILFFINEGNCGVNVGQEALDTVYTDANGQACATLPTPSTPGIYSIRAKFLGEDKPGVGDPPNGACAPDQRIQLSASNVCEEVTVTFDACNQPPVASCPGDTSIFACDLSEICLPGFNCTDPDGNLQSCYVSLGTLSGGDVCFTPSGPGTYTITLIATDTYGAADTCQTLVTVGLNSAPVCSLPSDAGFFVCGDTTFSFPVSATDVDGNLTGCTQTGGVGSFDGANWTFTTSGPGVYSATFSCADDCGASCGGTVNITVGYNQAPVATCPGDQTLFVCDLSPITLSGFSCSDADDNLLSCDAAGGTLNGDQVTFTPVAGVNTITLTATDACGATDVCETNVTVVLNTAPVATCPGDQTLFVCDLSPITLSGFSCSDADDNLLSCDAAGGTLSGDQVTFTPVEGVNTITLTATDACGATDVCQTNVTVTLNNPPVCNLPTPGTYFVSGDTTMSFPVSATDPDGNLVGCSMISGAGTFDGSTWTFTTNGPGTYTATFECEDACGEVCGGAAAGGTINMVVNYNQPPVATCPGDQTLFVCDLSPMTIPGFACDDPDGNLASCTVDLGSLSGGEVTFTPTAGPNTITLIATDDAGLADTCQTVITINVNNAPVCNLPSDASYFVCGDTTFNFPVSATDPDGNLTGCTMTAGPGSFDGSSWTFTTNGPGVYTASFECADDCNATCGGTVSITVGYNQAPVATCPGDQTLFVCDLSPITLSGFVCADADGNQVSCDATGGTLSGDEVTFTPAAGINTITLTATDACGASNTCQTEITVVLNSPPVVTCPGDQTVNFACEPSEICLPGFGATDADDNIISETVSLGTLTGGTVCFTPDAPGIYTIVYSVTDECGAIEQCSVDITVSYTNEAPVATCPGDQTLFVCDLSPITLSGFSCDDPDGNLTSCEAAGGVLNGDQITFTPVVGVNTLTLTATDACGLTDECQTNVTIVMNTAPTATCPGDITLFVCDLSDITLPGFACADPDDNLVSCVATGGTLNGSEVTLSPVAGSNVITLTATDACGATDVCQTTVTVVVNQMPYLNLPENDNRFLCDNNQICYTLDFGDPDYPANQTEPTAYLLSGPGNISGHELCFTPAEGVDDTYWFVIQVCDDCGTPSNPALPSPPNSCVIDSFSVTVTFNQPPVVECPSALDTFMCAIEPITLDGFNCDDPDGNLVSCETNVGSPTGGSVTFTPVDGVNYVILTATDECGSIAACTTEVNVTLNQAPIASCPGNAAYTVCDPETICISGFSCDDPDGNLVSCEVVGQTLDNGTVCFMPVDGVNDLMLVATDDCGMVDTCHTTVTINLIPPPVVNDTAAAVALCSPNSVCFGLPSVTGGQPPYSWTFDGRDVADTVCIYLDQDTVITAALVVTDGCGHADTAAYTITAVVNSAPTLTVIDPPTSVFACYRDTVKIHLSAFDPDDGLEFWTSLGLFRSSDSAVWFLAGDPFYPSGNYCDTIIVNDACQVADTAIVCFHLTVNTPPVCNLPDDQSFIQCSPTEVCLPVGATDVDDNLVGCEIVSGPGTLADGMWCYTPTGDQSVTVTVRCWDECDGVYGYASACEGSFTIDFEINEPPVAECPDNIFKAMFELSEICVPGFSCSDADGNLADCRAVIDGVDYPVTGGEVCFMPVWGDNDIYLIAEDDCGRTDTCLTTVMVTRLASCPVIAIEKTHGTLQGHYEDVSLTYQLDPDAGIPDIGGFDILIGYDASALCFAEAELGQLLEDCGWEYFTYRYGVQGNCGNACPSGLLRIIAIAETNNGANHPTCYGPPDTDPHELATMRFLVSNDRTLECQYVPIYFFWADCSDNALSTLNGDSLILDSKIFDFEGNLIWDENDDDIYPEGVRIPFVGAADYCLAGDKVTPIRCLELYNGGIDIVCSDSIDARGDLNCNGVPNEVADAVMLTNYFISGLGAFGDHLEASIAASDVNADGVTLSVADMVYLVRVIVGDAAPYYKPLPSGPVTMTTHATDEMLTVDYSASDRIGAALLTFELKGTVGQPVMGDGAEGMDIEYSVNGDELRVLVYNIGSQAIASGDHELLSIPISGSLVLTGVEAADYYGNILNVTSRTIPAQFSLSQNRPNPFNPLTTISLSMPVSADWTLTIFNISGQVVRQYSGSDNAGTVRITWDGTDNYGQKVASGIYLYRATAGQYTETRKMVLMK